MSAVTLASIQAKQAELDDMIQQLLEQAETTTVHLPAREITLRAGESYAGVVLTDAGRIAHHVVLLPYHPSKRLNWRAAMEWAAEQGADLPSPQEQALLYANCRQHIQADWYWSNKAEGDDYAWYCNFGYGIQFYYPQLYEGAAVAVRRVNP